MTLTELVYFCEVAKTKHFTAAANNLFVSQSTLSYAIKELEEELDAPLFIRRPNKHIELTKYGEELLPRAQQGIKILEEGKNEVLSMRSTLQGTVKIGFFFSIVFTVIPHIIQNFREDNPDSMIEFDTSVFHNWVDLRDILLNGRCDMVISAGEIKGGCKSQLIGRHRLMVTVPREHPLAKCETVSLEELAKENLIMIDPNSNMDVTVKNMFRDANLTPTITYASDWTSQRLRVMEGRGVALSTYIPIETDLFCTIEIASEKAIMPLYLTWPADRKLSKSVEFIRNYIVEKSKEHENAILF